MFPNSKVVSDTILLASLDCQENDNAFIAAFHSPSNSLVIAFRGFTFSLIDPGTKTTENIIDDAKMWKASVAENPDIVKLDPSAKGDIQIHAGFMECYRFIKKHLDHVISKFSEAYPRSAIIFTGHSLGFFRSL